MVSIALAALLTEQPNQSVDDMLSRMIDACLLLRGMRETAQPEPPLCHR